MGYTKVYNHLQPSTTTQNDRPTTIHKHLKNHPQPPRTIHSHPQLQTTISNHPQLPTTAHNYPQTPKHAHKTTHNYLQPSTTTIKLPKKAKTCHKQLCYCTLDVNTEKDVGFDSDIKQWYIYKCVSVCVCVCLCVFVCIYFIKHIYYFSIRLIGCICQYSK